MSDGALYAFVLVSLWIMTIFAAGLIHYVTSEYMTDVTLPAKYAPRIPLAVETTRSAEHDIDSIPPDWDTDRPVRFCPACRTFNDSSFDYCRNCAASIQTVAPISPTAIEPAENGSLRDKK